MFTAIYHVNILSVNRGAVFSKSQNKPFEMTNKFANDFNAQKMELARDVISKTM